jgi:hypothetical protein
MSTEVSTALRVIVLFVVGGAVLTVCDGFHTHSGTTAYAQPVFLLMAWWTPLLFGATAGFGGALFAVGCRLLGTPRKPTHAQIAAASVLFVAIYFASGFLPLSSAPKTALLFAGTLVCFAISDRTWQGALLAVVAAICGCAVEITLSHAGAFWYVQPDVWGIPYWLPCLYLASGSAVGQAARAYLALEVTAPVGSGERMRSAATDCPAAAIQ